MEKIKSRFNENRNFWLTWIVAIIPLLFLAIIFNKIPAEIPVKFDETGKVIGYASKHSYHILIQSALGLIAAVFFTVLLKVILVLNFRPEKKNYEKVNNIMQIIILIMTVLFSFSSIMILVKFL